MLDIAQMAWKGVDVGSVTHCSVRAWRTQSTPQPLLRRKLGDLLQRSPKENPRTPRLSASKPYKYKISFERVSSTTVMLAHGVCRRGERQAPP